MDKSLGDNPWRTLVPIITLLRNRSPTDYPPDFCSHSDLREKQKCIKLFEFRIRETVAKDAETLFREVMDLSLPVAALRYWVRGLDAPDLPLESVEKDGEGRITDLTQDGWQLAYNGNISIESGSHRFEVPRRLTATRGDIEIRWASTEWQAITQ